MASTRMRALLLGTLCAGVLTGCETASGSEEPFASAALLDGAGRTVGRVELFEAEPGVRLGVRVEGIAAGEHGMHLHAVGSCQGAGFTGAGGHLNPAGRQHGAKNPGGSHLGDLPNLVVGADGRGAARVDVAGVEGGAERHLFDADGTALVVHAAPDDYATDPAGNAGARIACGVLQRAPRS